MNGNLASLLLVVSAPAFAEQPATTEQVFCGGQVVVVARVKAGNSEDCRLHMAADCLPQNGIRLSVTVREVLAVKGSWDKIMFSTYDPALSPRHVGELVGQTINLHADAISGAEVGMYLHNPTSAALTDADLERLYKGKTFIFTVLPPSSPGDTYWGGAWSLNTRNWAIKTMRRAAGNDCPALLQDHGRLFHGTPTADSPYRQALVSQVEAQLAHLTESQVGGVIVDQSLATAREINPGLDETMWTTLESEVGAAAVSMMTERGSAFDLGLRTVLDTLSTSELRKISASALRKDFADPAFVRFGMALKSSEIDLGNANVVLADAIKSVLEKRGLKVPP